MKRPRIFLTHAPGPRANYFGARALARLNALGEVVLNPDCSDPGTARVLDLARGCDVIVSDRVAYFDADRIAALTDLKALFRVAVDIRNIDVETASARGILVCQAGRSWVPAVAELVMGLMIDSARGISRANIDYKAGRVPRVQMGRQLAGSVAGIIGYGPLGQRVAELCSAFGMSVLVHDPYTTPADARHVATDLDALCARADFVIPLAVATPETENMIDAARLAMMQSTAFVINLSRGNLVDEAALRAALDGKQIAGAALDVGRAPDQMPELATAVRADVSATPHIGGLTVPAIEGQALEVVDQLETLLAGRMPVGAVNAAAAYRAQQWVGLKGR